jgi:hypothetical protein
MGRMGHSTTRAALIYQHRTAERDRLIASVMSELVEAELDEMACHRARSGTRATGRILMSANGIMIMPVSRRFVVERVTRIELALSAWE